jgi:general secretion pathway protein F
MTEPVRGTQPMFSYRIATAEGAIVAGEIAASSRERAVAMLRARGEWPLELRQLAASQRRAEAAIPLRDMAIGLRVLATILDAHVPVGRAMHVAAPSLPPSWQSFLPLVTSSLESGETFAASLRIARLRTPLAVAGLLAAGEAAGDLSGALRRSAELTEKSATARAAIINAMAYPMLLLFAGTGVVSLLVAVVIPRFAGVLANLGQELPASTRLVLSISTLLRASLLPLIGIAAMAAVGWASWTRTELGRRQWHELLLKVPLLGSLRHALATSRAADALAALLESGLPVAAALKHAAVASGDAAVEKRVIDARQRIVEGARIAQALSLTEAFTPSATRLIGAGEAGGALSALLRHAAGIEDAAARSRMQTLTRVLEPAFILILGAVIAGVAIALLQAVYSVRVDRL